MYSPVAMTGPHPAVPGLQKEKDTMFEVQMLIPLADNDGETFPAAHHAVFEEAIVDSFGGFTRLEATAAGSWRNADGVIMTDVTRIYAVAVVSITDGDKLGALVRFAKAFYLQEALFIRYLGIIEIL
jgi:hypothetical protein